MCDLPGTEDGRCFLDVQCLFYTTCFSVQEKLLGEGRGLPLVVAGLTVACASEEHGSCITGCDCRCHGPRTAEGDGGVSPFRSPYGTL